MSGINFLSDNQLDYGSFTITTGAANAQFPIENLQLAPTAKKFRSTGNTVVFEIDLGTNRNMDTVAIVGDATGDLGVTDVSIKTSLTTDFSLSPTITLNLSNQHNIGYEFFTGVAHRFVEVTLTGTGSYAELSNIFIGERINIPLNSFSIDSFRYENQDRSRVRENEYGTKFIDSKNYQRKISGSIQYCTKDEFQTLDNMFLYHGVRRPLWLILDPDDSAMNDSSYRLAMYSYLDSVPAWSASGGQTYNCSVKLEQVI